MTIFKIRISKYTEYPLILDQIRHEQYLDRDTKGLNWSSEGSWLVLLGGSTNGLFRGSQGKQVYKEERPGWVSAVKYQLFAIK